MNVAHKFDVQNLHAYIDGDLSLKEKSAFEKAMQIDEALKDEVCELRKIKQQILEHYQKVEIPPMPKLKDKKSGELVHYWPIAASVALAFGLGFFVSQTALLQPDAVSTNLVAQNLIPNKIILHIDSDQPQRVQALLQTANNLLQKTSAERPKAQIEIVANDHGIDLFDQGNKNRAEIIEMLKKYDNLKLIACKRALERRAEMGHPVKLISNVETNRPAMDEIIDKMQQGWSYHKF